MRGRGECRVPDAPAAWCAHRSGESMHTSIHSGSTGITRHPPRDGFTASFVLFPGTIGAVDPVAPSGPRLAARWGSARFHQDLDDDHGAPEPHAFSVRNTAARQARGARSRLSSPCNCLAHTTASRPPHPAPRLVTIGRTPLCIGTGCGDEITNFRKTEAKYFRGRAGQQFARRAVGQIT